MDTIIPYVMTQSCIASLPIIMFLIIITLPISPATVTISENGPFPILFLARTYIEIEKVILCS